MPKEFQSKTQATGPLQDRYTCDIAALLDGVLLVNKAYRLPSANLTNKYETISETDLQGHQFYVAYNGGIQRVFIDRKADDVFPARSSIDDITTEEFLSWLEKEPSRKKDLYQHLVDYIRELPSLLERKKPVESRKNQEPCSACF
ncbi:MAG: hypothetical protein V1837_03725 [Candidatus Woesearchaeota archaeon]